MYKIFNIYSKDLNSFKNECVIKINEYLSKGYEFVYGIHDNKMYVIQKIEKYFNNLHVTQIIMKKKKI